MAGRFQVFEDSIQGPAPLYTKDRAQALDRGVSRADYRFEVVVKDIVTGKVAADTIEFEVKYPTLRYCTLACRVTGGSLPACTLIKRRCVAFAASSSSVYGRSVTSTSPML